MSAVILAQRYWEKNGTLAVQGGQQGQPAPLRERKRSDTIGASRLSAIRIMYVFRLLGFLRPYKGRTALAFLSVLAASAFVLAMPQIIRWAIDYGLGLERQGGGLVATGERHFLVVAAVAIVAAAVLRGAFAFAQTYLVEWISQRVAYDLRNSIYDRLQRLSYAYHDRQQTGQLMSRATQDVEAVRWFIHMGVMRAGYIALLLAGILVLMAITERMCRRPPRKRPNPAGRASGGASPSPGGGASRRSTATR